MNRLFLILLSLSSLDVFASKARVQALGDSFHLVDPQTIYSNPIDLAAFDNFVSLETGLTAATSINNGAEAMISYSLNENHQFALSLGHQDAAVTEARNFINILSGTTFEPQQNPVGIFYAIKDSVTSYAFGAFYSNRNDKLAALTESSFGLSTAVEMGKLQLSTLYTFVNSVEGAAGKKFDGSGYLHAIVTYLLDETTFELTYITSKTKMSTGLGDSVTDNESHVKDIFMLGLADSNIKDENDFFWGAQVVSTTINCKLNLSTSCDKSFTHTVLPAWIGIEAQASDWLTVRGAIKQSFLFNIIKDDFGYPVGVINGTTGATTNIPAGENSTIVSAGLGLKFKKLTLDGTLSAASTQLLNTTNFLSQVGLTYNF